MNRLHNLDYLRGLAAFGIMVYHYSSWSFGNYSADSFMGRLGIYGVSIFYILSGLTLYYVYYDNISASKEAVTSFLKKRIYRIFPLLWLATIASIVVSKNSPSLYDIFLNLSGLFGFFNWDSYLATGAWSIGNELVFYIFFPFFVLFSKSFKSMMIFTSILIFCIYLYFAFVIFDNDLTLAEQWRNYVNPLNQLFLFLGGFLTGLLLQNTSLGMTSVTSILSLGVGIFLFYPVTGDTVNLVLGLNRIIFTSCCLLICAGFYKLEITFPSVVHKPLTLLGETSYSIYLLHPIVYKIVGFVLTITSNHIINFPAVSKPFISAISTLIVSYFVYQKFEKLFMRLGKAKKVFSTTIS